MQKGEYYRRSVSGRNKRTERDGERAMAYIKIFPIKVTDKKLWTTLLIQIRLMKTTGFQFGCSPETADLEFAMTRESAKRMEWIKATIWHSI